jgi:ankyrin repeat protein
MLLEKVANIEAKDRDSRTPLFSAAKEGKKAVVQLLLEKGANPKYVDIELLKGVCKHMIRDAQAKYT